MGNLCKYFSCCLLTTISSGVGFGICQRLLSNFLGLEQPVESLPQATATPGDRLPCPYAPCTRLTIIMACRSQKQAEDARRRLLEKLDEEIEYRSEKGSSEQRARYKKFRETVRLDILSLELSLSSSVLDFCDMVQQRYEISCIILLFTDPCVRYPYVSHLIFNAGNAPWIGIDWLAAIFAVITNFMRAVTYPRFKLQQTGLMSEEGFGYTWMCNVFGHFILVRLLYHVQPVQFLICTVGSKTPAHPRKEPLAGTSPLDNKHRRRRRSRLIRFRRLAVG
jgi:3-keto steroid reductase